jgi:hypothetical protein
MPFFEVTYADGTVEEIERTSALSWASTWRSSTTASCSSQPSIPKSFDASIVEQLFG